MSAPSTPPLRDPVSEKDFRFSPTGIPCEWAESYHPGGLHPVHLGDVFNGQYEVIRKLGNGSFGTVWLALDLVHGRYVAIKVEMAKLEDSKQLSTILELTGKARQDKNSRFIVTLLDSFIHSGPNGKHPCLVFEAMGPSVSSILNAPQVDYDPLHPQPRCFPKNRTKAILRNVLCGLSFLHDNGIVHGDLQSGNMLFALQDLAGLDAKKLRQDEANSRKETLERTDGKVDKWAPKYLIVSDPLSDYVLSQSDEFVKISDLGGAFREDDPPRSVVTPKPLRAPEVILGCPLTRSIDIWSFGCLVFELLTGQPLFQLSPVGDDESLDDEHLIQLTDTVQPLPDDLLTKWPRASRYYGPDGERLDARPWDFDGSDGSHRDEPHSDADDEDDPEHGELDDLEEDEYDVDMEGPPGVHDSVEKLFRDNKPDDIDDEEESLIISLLRSILQYNALLRPSAKSLLEYSWINN